MKKLQGERVCWATRGSNDDYRQTHGGWYLLQQLPASCGLEICNASKPHFTFVPASDESSVCKVLMFPSNSSTRGVRTEYDACVLQFEDFDCSPSSLIVLRLELEGHPRFWSTIHDLGDGTVTWSSQLCFRERSGIFSRCVFPVVKGTLPFCLIRGIVLLKMKRLDVRVLACKEWV